MVYCFQHQESVPQWVVRNKPIGLEEDATMYHCLECRQTYKRTRCNFDYYREEHGKGKRLLAFCSGRCQRVWYERNGEPEVTAIRVENDGRATDAVSS